MILRRMLDRCKGSDGADAGFALIYAALITLVITLMSVAVLSLVVHEAKPTQFARKREQTLNTAEAGLEAGLNRLRSSVKADGTGNLSALPCNSGKNAYTFSGSPDGGSTTYTSTIYYLNGAHNPAVQGLAPGSPTLNYVTANAMTCPASRLMTQPSFAFIQSEGAVGGEAKATGDRTLHATYSFQTINRITSGGRIKEYNTSGDPGYDNCYDVGTNPQAIPTVGTPVTLQPCVAVGTPSQSWTYGPNLTIQWTGDNSGSQALCIQASSTMSPQLQACAGAQTGSPACTSSPPTAPPSQCVNYAYLSTNEQQQEWSYNDDGHLEAAANDGSLNGAPCLQPATTSSSGPTTLVLTGCSGGTYDKQAVNPDPAFGAGGASGTQNGLPRTAGYPGNDNCGTSSGTCTGQLTNYQETGRCLDVTGQHVDSTAEIDYPCKQAPNSSLQTWNQIFTYTPITSKSGTLSTALPPGAYANGTNSPIYYCLTAEKPWIQVQLCNGTGSAGSTGSGDALTTQQWSFTGSIEGDYDDSYNIKSTALDPAGQCMTIVGKSTTPGQPDGPYLGKLLSSMALAACDGSDVQKWNAPPFPRPVKLVGVQEDPDH